LADLAQMAIQEGTSGMIPSAFLSRAALSTSHFTQPNIVHVTAFFAGIGGCCTLALAYHRYRMDKQKEAIEIERWNAENTVNTYVSVPLRRPATAPAEREPHFTLP
jgi:hypothetical protein